MLCKIKNVFEDMLCLRNNYKPSEAPSVMKRQYKTYFDIQAFIHL